MTREYSLQYTECKEDERTIFIKSQNKKNTAKKRKQKEESEEKK